MLKQHFNLVTMLLAWHLLSLAAVAAWPQFRGPDGRGCAIDERLPIHWSESQNLTWKAAIPGRGLSSPVVAGDQIWLTTAVEDGRSLHAVSVARSTGQLVKDVELFNFAESAPVHPKNSYATPTPIVDENRVYVNFGTFGTACLSLNGEVLWKNTSLKFQQPYASASSPVIFQNLLLLSCDGTDSQFVAALDKHTGQTVWLQHRVNLATTQRQKGDEPASPVSMPLMAYSTPLLIRAEGTAQLVTPAAGHVASYNPLTGELLWWFRYEGFSLVAQPVYGQGLVFVVGCEQQSRITLFAIPIGCRGEVRKEQLAWSANKNVGHVPSPLLIDKAIYIISDSGVATCLDAETGRSEWRQRIGGNYSASPIYADGKILVLSENGKATIFAADRHFEQLAENQLEGIFMASPAVVDNCLLLRSDACLYRFDIHD